MVKWKQNHTNPFVTDYYRVDRTLSHLNTRFPPELEGVLLATFLLPGNINNVSNKVIADIKAEYAAHLPYPSSFESEVTI